MTNKGKGCNKNITLKHNGRIMNKSNDVCDILMASSPIRLWKSEVMKFEIKKKSIIMYKIMPVY